MVVDCEKRKDALYLEGVFKSLFWIIYDSNKK